MPREQIDWYMEQSLHDDENLHARQCCTYCSIVNVNKSNYPYSSSFEQEQTWTLTRTMSNQNKRYQSSIENIHLTIPYVLNITTPYSSKTDYEIDKIKIEQSIPLVPPARQYTLSSYHSKGYQQPMLTSSKKSTMKKSQLETNSMRIMNVNGEYIVRI